MSEWSQSFALTQNVFREPGKGVLHPGSPHSSHRERQTDTLHFQSPLLLSLEVPGKQTSPPCLPTGLLWGEIPISRAFFYTLLRAREGKKDPWYNKISPFSQSPQSRIPPCMFPHWGLYRERCSISRASGLCVHSYLSESPVKDLCHKMGGKHIVTVHGAPRGQQAYIRWGAAWFPKGIIYSIAITTPVPCSLQHNTFHLGLGRPESH